MLCAVFVPVAFISGLTGEFYRQFALTIAISTVISAFNSLTLSPALAAVLLKAHDAPKDVLAPLAWTQILGRFFGGFNRAFAAAGNGYCQGADRDDPSQRHRARDLRGSDRPVLVGVQAVPGGFIPDPGQAVPDRGRAAAAGRLARPHRGSGAPHVRDRA